MARPSAKERTRHLEDGPDCASHQSALGHQQRDPKISAWLQQNDPKALAQVNDALERAGYDPLGESMGLSGYLMVGPQLDPPGL